MKTDARDREVSFAGKVVFTSFVVAFFAIVIDLSGLVEGLRLRPDLVNYLHLFAIVMSIAAIVVCATLVWEVRSKKALFLLICSCTVPALYILALYIVLFVTAGGPSG